METTPREPRKSIYKRVVSNSIFSVTIVVLIVSALLAILSPSFLTFENFRSILVQLSIKGIVAIAILLVLIPGCSDLSFGASMCLCTVIVARTLVDFGIRFVPVMIILALLTGVIVGVFNGFLVAQLRLVPFLATLGAQYLVRGIVYIVTDATAIRGLPEEWLTFWTAVDTPLPPVVFILFGVAIVTALLIKFTKFGRHLFAVGGNRAASELSGINVKMVIFKSYILTGLLAGVVGIMFVGRIMAFDPAGGIGFEFEGIAAAAIGGASLSGGKGSVSGSILGALVLTLLQNGLVLLSVPAFYQTAFTGCIIFVAMIVDMIANRQGT